MWNKTVIFFRSLSLGLGVILLAGPFVLDWWIHGDYDRYLWIINGPYPYSSFGSGPFQLAMYIGSLLLGVALIAISIKGRIFINKEKKVLCFKIQNFEEAYAQNNEVIEQAETAVVQAGALPVRIHFPDRTFCVSVENPDLSAEKLISILKQFGLDARLK